MLLWNPEAKGPPSSRHGMNDSILRLAIEVAKSSPSKKQVGAVLLSKGRVLTTAVNLEDKTHPVQAKWARRAGLEPKQYLHAEIAALVRCRQEADTIVVARVNGQGHLRTAKPCPICAMALKEAGVSKVWYTTNDGFVYQY